MTVEVLLQHFVAGGDGREGREHALAVLAPFLPQGLDPFGVGRVVTADGGAEVFGLSDRSTSGAAGFGDLRGDEVWQVLLEVAAATGWTILPVGQAPILAPGQHLEDLPPSLRDHAVELDPADPVGDLRVRLRGVLERLS